jgi:hypothetical protein
LRCLSRLAGEATQNYAPSVGQPEASMTKIAADREHWARVPLFLRLKARPLG